MKTLTAPTRAEVEDFLFHEADLLDRWELNEWLNLFEPGATYEIPSTDMPGGDPHTSLFLVADSWERLQARVKRLKSRNAHIENPRSRTRRMVANVRVRPTGDGTTVRVDANFVIHRMRYELVDSYIGRYEHLVGYGDGTLRFRSRKAILDLEALRPTGKVSIII